MNEFTAQLKFAKESVLGGVPFEKNLYIESPNTRNRYDAEVDAYRLQHQIVVSGCQPPKPVLRFEETSFPEYVLSECRKAGFKEPTPIQAQTWPVALMGRDCIALAITGSGKTLAYILPAVVHINAQPMLQPGDGPIALVVAPTRELAIQIQEQTTKFGRSSRIQNTVLYGGVPRAPQMAALQKGVEIVIATPGRLCDLIAAHSTNLHRVTFLVLDEADRMLDMGFEPYIRRLVGMTNTKRQTLMFSATWPKAVRSLAAEFLQHDVVTIKVGYSELQTSHTVTQEILLLQEEDKAHRILDILRDFDLKVDRTLVFVETKAKCDGLTQTLREQGVPALGLHGDKKQDEREWVLTEFKEGRCMVLVATSVAGRGLDIKDIHYVINFDFPAAIEDYVHRIGRTGRAGEGGKAISFFCSKDYRLAPELLKILEESEQAVAPALALIAGSTAPPVSTTATTSPTSTTSAASAGSFAVPGPVRHSFAASAPSPRAVPYPPVGTSSSAPAAGSATFVAPASRIISPTTVGSSSSSSLSAVGSTSPTDADGTTVPPPNWSAVRPNAIPLLSCEDPDFETVLMLRNMVLPPEANDELQDDVQDECTKYGPVEQTMMFVVTDPSCPPEESVRIFVKFKQREVCYRALVEMNGRAFGGRLVCASIYDHLRYREIDLKPSPRDPPMPRVILLRNLVAPGDVDDELELEVKDECMKFGPVKEVKVREVADGSVTPEETVRIFVCFEDTESTLDACRALNGRLFNGRLTNCVLFDNNRYFAKDLDPNSALEPVLPLKCYLPLTQPD
eukprot:RCo028039